MSNNNRNSIDAVFEDLLNSWYTAEHEAIKRGTSTFKSVSALVWEYNQYKAWWVTAKDRGNVC